MTLIYVHTRWPKSNILQIKDKRTGKFKNTTIKLHKQSIVILQIMSIQDRIITLKKQK